MKKYLALIFMAVVAFALAACGGKTTASKNTTEATQPTTTKAEATTTKADVTTTEAAGDLDKAVDAKYTDIVKDKKIYLTTCGQSDIEIIRSLIEALDETEELMNFYDPAKESPEADCINIGTNKLLNASDVEIGSVVFLTLGTSGKGLGSAGTDVTQETARAKAFADRAEAGEITLVIFHVGGADRRGANTDPVLEAVCAKAEIAFVVEGGNADGYFTNLTESGVSVYRYSKTAKITSGLAVLFNIEA